MVNYANAIMWKLIESITLPAEKQNLRCKVAFFCPFIETCEEVIEELYAEVDRMISVLKKTPLGHFDKAVFNRKTFSLGDRNDMTMFMFYILEQGRSAYDSFMSDPQSWLPPTSDEHFDLNESVGVWYPKKKYSTVYTLLDSRIYDLEESDSESEL